MREGEGKREGRRQEVGITRESVNIGLDWNNL